MGSFVSIPGFSRERCRRLRGFESLEQGNVGSICSAIRDEEVVHMLVTWSILAFLISALCWIVGGLPNRRFPQTRQARARRVHRAHGG